jgi:uncharacterized membrane protein
MSPSSLARTRAALRYALAATYAPFGVLHVAASRAFLPIMPPQVPFPETVVKLTGAAEIAGALGLLIPATRKAAGIGLALYAVCVYPANVYQAFWHRHAPPLPDSWWYHGPRLAFQPVLVWWALVAGGVIAWPFAPRRRASGPHAR